MYIPIDISVYTCFIVSGFVNLLPSFLKDKYYPFASSNIVGVNNVLYIAVSIFV